MRAMMKLVAWVLLLGAVIYFALSSALFMWRNPTANQMQIFVELPAVLTQETLLKFQPRQDGVPVIAYGKRYWQGFIVVPMIVAAYGLLAARREARWRRMEKKVDELNASFGKLLRGSGI